MRTRNLSGTLLLLLLASLFLAAGISESANERSDIQQFAMRLP